LKQPGPACSLPTPSDMLSIIIPTLNEAATIGSLLESIKDQTISGLEVIIADGGSSDETTTVAEGHGARITHSDPGRGQQLNKGAEEATGDYLLFLHADSEFTRQDQLARAMEFIAGFDEHTAGHFPMEFVSGSDETAAQLRYFAAKTHLNRPGTFNGDQGLLIRADAFKLLGGFSERYGFLEDQDFGERFGDYGEFVTLPDPLRTSARRFEREGVEERILLNTIIMGMFHLRQDRFFSEAPDIYRASAGNRLNPLPFLQLARQSVMADGFWTGLARCYRIGRYANRNFWQVFFWAGIQLGEEEQWLRSYDRYASRVTRNPLGDTLATVVVLSWFFTTLASLSIRNR